MTLFSWETSSAISCAVGIFYHTERSTSTSACKSIVEILAAIYSYSDHTLQFSIVQLVHSVAMGYTVISIYCYALTV